MRVCEGGFQTFQAGQMEGEVPRFMLRPDLTRSGDWETGRPSEPAYMDMPLGNAFDSLLGPVPNKKTWKQFSSRRFVLKCFVSLQ